MQNPRNLKVTNEAMALAVLTYRVTTAFPASERFGLSSQMRRAAVSVGSNIAEGCGRSGNAARLSFLHIALGSATELEFQLALALRLGLGRPADFPALSSQSSRVKGMLTRLIVALRRRPNTPAD
ncbi:MAG: four helix bundle protein [Gemmatimonadaceae bacterium]|nr:four helix bundle protein [Gemmatimonadaceae bacterium]